MKPLGCITLLCSICLISSDVTSRSKCCRKPDSVTMDCSGCKLKDIPPLTDTKITSLYLNDNLIRSIEDYAFVHMAQLININLRNNQLKRLDNYTFEGLVNLKVLDIYQNDGYFIANEAFKPLTVLETLKVGSFCPNVTCRFPKEAFAHLSNDVNFLEVPVLSNFVFGEEFSHLHKLQTLVVFGHACSLGYISNETFAVFANSLRTLEVHDCKVSSLSQDSFSRLTKLQSLNFACNRNMSLPGILAAVKRMPSATLDTLITDGVHSGSILNELKSEWFNSSKFLNLKRLSLRQTNIISVDLDTIFYTPSLEFLNLGYNSILTAKYNNITELLEFIDKRNVTSIDLTYMGHSVGSHNAFRERYCRFADIYSDDFFPKPPSYVVKPDPVPCCNHSLVKGNLNEMLSNNIPQSLLYFYLPAMGLPTTDVHEASFNNDNNILFLDFSGIRIKRMYGPIRGLSKLQGIDLSGCGIEYVHPSILNNFPSLTFLNISGNELSYTQWDRLFKDAKLIRTLDLSSNRLEALPDNIFTGLLSLKTAILNNNPLGKLFIKLENNNNLTVLDLRNTSLIVRDRFMTELDNLQNRINHTLQLKLQGNIFQCNCSSLEFLKWLKTTVVDIVDQEHLQCDYHDKHCYISAVNLEDLERICEKSMHWLTVLLTPVVTVISVIAVIVVTHHYRWSLKWKFYLIRRTFRYRRFGFSPSQSTDTLSTIDVNEVFYNAFVSYNHSFDYGWVESTLLPKVEDEWGLSLCIAQRDFMPGVPIAENICKAIDNSRYVIMVITPSFISSNWCNFEMHMALVKGIQHLIIIYKDELDVDKMSKTLRFLMSSINYIEYSESTSGNGLFWTRLQDKLTSHIPA